MDPNSSLGRCVKQRRQALALTQHELAQRVGCALSTIQKIEIDDRHPSRQMAELLAHHLALSAGERDAFLHLARRQPVETPLLLPRVSPTQRRFNNLPHPLTSLVGREWEVTMLSARLLEDNVRLLTITGPPGIGKTRLSLQVAATMHDHFADGVCLVMLAPIGDARFVAVSIARALGVNEVSGQPLLVRIKDYLYDKHLLLVLDNFEHVLAEAPLIVELLEAAPRLKVLATSRASLQVYGEQEFAVPPLSVPDLNQLPSPDKLMHYTAVALFVQRARAVQPKFELSEVYARTVAEICVRLEGLPLAIELAAARSKMLSPPALLARLTGSLMKPLDLLTGVQHLPARQRTLRVAIAWSYELLNPTEQAVFRYIGVFAGGCTLPAVQAVIPVAFSTRSEHWLLQTLQSLVNQSLVNQQPDSEGEPRFTLLEMLREYALEQLDQKGEGQAARRAHAIWFTQFAETCNEANAQPESSVQALNKMELEVVNLRTALHWTTAHDVELELRLAQAMISFWTSRSNLHEGRQALEDLFLRLQADIQFREAQMHQYAQVVGALGFITWLQGDTDPARARLEESITLWRQLKQWRELGMALHFLALTLYDQDDYTSAYERAEESVVILRPLDDSWHLANALSTLAILTLVQGDANTACLLNEECLDLFRNIGDDWGIGLGLISLSEVFYTQGDDVRARTCLEEALQTYRKQDNPWFAAQTLLALGKVLWRQGQRIQATALLDESILLSRQVGAKRFLSDALLLLGLAAQEKGDREWAQKLFRDSLVLFQDIGSKAGAAYALGGLAAVIDRPTQAVKWLGSAAVVLDDSRLSMDQIERSHFDRTVVSVRAEQDAATFAVAWTEGRAQPLGEAIREALAS